MKAMIFAAGLGTRLRPLTDTCPKALIEVNGRPLLALILQRLQRFGFHEILINVHYLADQVLEWLERNPHPELDIRISDETAQLLDTGGALKKAAWFFDDGQPFLVHNVDILSDIDLAAFYDVHRRRPQALASLAVSERPATRCLLFDRGQRLCGWRNRASGETKLARDSASPPQELAFSGIHTIDPKLFSYMPEQDVFSIIDVYLQAAKTEQIFAFPHDHRLWLDVGKTEQLAKAGEILQELDG